jgi:N-ethylmaleimide reductase
LSKYRTNLFTSIYIKETYFMTADLYSPLKVGAWQLPNRFVMAPMTRSRAKEGNVPSELAVTYYTQRASAGLIITEGSQVSPQGAGYLDTPGIYSDAQIAGWQKITKAVHEADGRIILQLWHVGRVSHPSFHGGALPVAPSAVGFEGETYTPQGLQSYVTPRALELSELPGIVEQFRQGSKNAKEAGFDGVEIHGANGYLLDQFLQDVSNKRTDEYGGSAQNRARLLLEVTQAVVDVWSAERVGVRLSPSGTINGMGDSNPAEPFGYAVQELAKFGLAYLHLMESFVKPAAIDSVITHFRPLYPGIIITNNGYNFETATQIVQSGQAELVSFGNLFLANPDLPERFRLQAPLNSVDRSTFYGGDAKGYTDYPSLALATRS